MDVHAHAHKALLTFLTKELNIFSKIPVIFVLYVERFL